MLEALELDTVPFGPDPSPESIFPSSQLVEAEKRLMFAVGAKGIGEIEGDSGVGKTTVLRYVAKKLESRGHRVLYSADSTGGAFGLLRSLHYALGVKPPHFKSDLSHGFVEACVAAEESIVVIVDEGQLIGPEALQQLRLLTNRDFDTRPPFSLILAGCPELHEILAQPRMTSLRKRVLMSYHLEGLTEDEAKLYLDHHLKRAGARRKLFDPAVVREMFGYSRGNPRALNQMALTALVAAVSRNKQMVGPEELRQAVVELEARP